MNRLQHNCHDNPGAEKVAGGFALPMTLARQGRALSGEIAEG